MAKNERICRGACHGIIDLRKVERYTVVPKKHRDTYYCNSCYRTMQEEKIREYVKGGC